MLNDIGECKVALFERALWRETREAYLQHREHKRNVGRLQAEQLAAYVLGDDCTADIEKLAAQNFDFPLPHQVKLRKSHSDRRRTIYVYPERQNMLMKYLSWLLHAYDPIFSDNLYSFRLKRSTADLFQRLEKRGYGRTLWVVKADVRDYGHSIRPELLLPKLERIVGEDDPTLMAFLEYLLTRDEFLRGGVRISGCMGGLPGLPLSPFFNNVYLMELDNMMAQSTVLSSRYADDIAMFAHSREEAQAALDGMRAIVGGLSLRLNEDKTQLLAPGERFELLGIEVSENALDVADSTVAKAKFKLGHFAHKLVLKEQREGLARAEAAQLMVNKVNKYFFGDLENEHELSWRDFFFRIVTRPDSLRDIDHHVQGLIRYVATGKLTDARYRFRYKDMRKLGYTPLVSDYYRYRREAAEAASTIETEA